MKGLLRMSWRRVLLILAILVLLIVILAFNQPHPPPSDGKLPPIKHSEVYLRDQLGIVDYGDRAD